MSLSVWSRHQGIIVVQVQHIIVSQLKLVETTDKMQKNLICCWLRKKILCQNVKTDSLTNTISNTNTSEEENNSNISEFHFQRGTAFREGLRRPSCKKTSDYYDQSLTSLYECTTTTRTLYDNVWISNSSLLQVQTC